MSVFKHYLGVRPAAISKGSGSAFEVAGAVAILAEDTAGAGGIVAIGAPMSEFDSYYYPGNNVCEATKTIPYTVNEIGSICPSMWFLSTLSAP